MSDRENNDFSEFSDDLASTFGTFLGTASGIPGGATVGKFISLYGKRLLAYAISEKFLKPDALSLLTNKFPPFLVVGLGRCGCHVIAELAEIISNSTFKEGTPSQNPKKSLAGLFRSSDDKPPLIFEPVMLVGDIDETTFLDVDGLLKEGKVSDKVTSKLLKLNYKPLAEGGVGHVPLFAEFVTRGLLLLPDEDMSESDSYWIDAKNFLVNNFVRNPETSRLVFYIFSAGGGSGAGSALEIMRAQRCAMGISKEPDPQIYFTGVAIIPQNISKDRRRLINTGRTIVQYLAELNIVLEDSTFYDRAPNFKTAANIEFSAERTVRIMPWEGLALISNDVMSAKGDHKDDIVPQEDIESNANKYIAQQMFNLAAAQFSAASFQDSDDKVVKENFQALRLDPQDLKTGLVGPYGICFSIAKSQHIMDTTGAGIDKMFLRGIGLPRYYEDEKEYIQGISIAPIEKEEYSLIVHRLLEKLSTKRNSLLTVDDFSELNKISVFKKCPRVVCVFTAPQKGIIPSKVHERLATLLEWLFPNRDQVRYAIVRGTTTLYTLSIYIETSVVLSLDIQMAVKNYLKLCWKQRRATAVEFQEKYESIIEQNPPIKDEDIIEWLGELEEYGVNIPNFDVLKEDFNNRWLDYVESSTLKEHHKQKLSLHQVNSSYLNAREVASALRFINYANHLEAPELLLG